MWHPIHLHGIIILLALHLSGDFLLQSRGMARNKSSSPQHLLLHCLVYAISFVAFGIDFAAILFFSHMLIDGLSSQLTTYFYKNQNEYAFFCVVGIDQFLHMVVLFAAASAMLR